MILQQRRAKNGEGTTDTARTVLPQSPPCWLKLERRGPQITGYFSADGQNWKKVETDAVTLGPSVLVGVALTSHDIEKRATAAFDHLILTKK
jgi:hypothetical protein